MEIAAEVWFWVGPKATGTARFGREPRRHGACIKGSYPTNPSVTCRSADGPAAVIALANRKGNAVRRSALASCASEVGTADCIRHVYPAWRAILRRIYDFLRSARLLWTKFLVVGPALFGSLRRSHRCIALRLPLPTFETFFSPRGPSLYGWSRPEAVIASASGVPKADCHISIMTAKAAL
jgi:hypothetical protein